MSIAIYCDENSQHISLKNSRKSVCIKKRNRQFGGGAKPVRFRKHDLKLNQHFSANPCKFSINISATKVTLQMIR